MADTRLILKNTAVLYIRMGLTVLVSLYTARIVLQQLGVENYGVYNVVGGVVAMLGFINAAMAGATSRFITYESASGLTDRLMQTFGSAKLIHYGIAAIVFILAETVGLWFVNARLVLPPGSFTAANLVYQFTIITGCLSVIQTPYHAVIISHERFTVYAYIEIFNVLAKLAVAYTLVIVTTHKLVIYGLLTLCVSAVSWLAYRIYCRSNFNESGARASWNSEIGRPMLSFSAWDLFGSMSVTANFQGYGLAMNMIYGAAINAAYGIANTVQGTLKGLALNVISASRPQVVKSYAAGKYAEMQSILTDATNLSLTVYLMMAIPLYSNASTILHLWLVDVPHHSVAFLRIVIISGIFSLLTITLNTAIHATGDIRRISFYPGIVNFAAPFGCYFLLKNGMPVDMAFNIIIAVSAINLCITLGIIKKQVPEFGIFLYFRQCYLPVMLSVAITIVAVQLLRIPNPILALTADIVFAVTVMGICYFAFCLTYVRRRVVISTIRSKYLHFFIQKD